MENKVGDNVPHQKKLDAILAKLTSGVEELREFCVNITEEDRSRLLHPRHGGDEKVEKTYDVCTRYDVTVKGVPAEGMMNDLRLAKQIRPFVGVLKSGARLVEDTSAQAQSEYWQAFLSLYGALARAAEHNPALAVEIQDLVEFMAVHGRKKKAKVEKAEKGEKGEKADEPKEAKEPKGGDGPK